MAIMIAAFSMFLVITSVLGLLFIAKGIDRDSRERSAVENNDKLL